MIVSTINVNGIRAGIRQRSSVNLGLLPWLEATTADVVCLQETRADNDQRAGVLRPAPIASSRRSASWRRARPPDGGAERVRPRRRRWRRLETSRTTENDIKNWRGNVKKSGFLPAERQWLTELLAAGWVDVVRVPDVPGPYSWWSRRGPRGWSGPRPMRCAGPTMLR